MIMKYLLSLTLLICVVASIDSTGCFCRSTKEKEAAKKLESLQCNQSCMFGRGISGKILPETFLDILLELREAYLEGKIQDSGEIKKLVFSLIALTQLTECTVENYNKFMDVAERNVDRQNLIAFVHWQATMFKNRCVDLRNEISAQFLDELEASNSLPREIREKRLRQLAGHHEDYLFDQGSLPSIEPETFLKWLLELRDVLERGAWTGSYFNKELTYSLLALTHFTRCTQENLDKFQRVIDQRSEYQNLISFVKWRRELYRKTCIQ